MPVKYPCFNCSQSIKDSEETTANKACGPKKFFLPATYVDLARHMWTKCDLNTGDLEQEFVMLPESVEAPLLAHYAGYPATGIQTRWPPKSLP